MEVNHNYSEHTMAVQRSRFLSIDDDISNENLQKMKAKFYDNPDQQLYEMPANFDARNYPEYNKRWRQLYPTSDRPAETVAPDRALRSTVSFDKSNQLSIRFCLEPEIERKRRILSIHKQ